MSEPSDFPPDMSEEEPPDSLEGSEFRSGGRRMLVVGGGRGGVGKSILAQNLAVYFAQLGKTVALVDADPTGSNLHSHFGLEASHDGMPADLDSTSPVSRWLVRTSVPGLLLLPAAHDGPDSAAQLRAGRKARWLSKVRSIPADFIVVDVGPGHSPFALDVMLSADIGICVTVPEPPAIETTYRFLRAAFRRRLRRSLAKDRLRLGLLERATRELGEQPAPLDLVRALAKMDTHLAQHAWSEAHRLRLYLAVTQTRVRTDLELGAWMTALVARHYGLVLDELGHVEHDDTVWLSVRRRKPLLVDSPTSKAARNLERIARRVVALLAARDHRVSLPPPVPPEIPNLYSILGVSRSANDEEVRRAYKRQREMYAQGGLATSSLLTEAQRADEHARLDEAYDTLLDAVRRRAYDLTSFPSEEAPLQLSPSERPALAVEQLMLQSELLREIGPETEFTGALLRKVRESQGIELGEISQKTKIARSHLEALEEEAWSKLPAIVYVRGFVSEVAKCLKLDPLHVQRTYLRRFREKAEP